MPFLLVFAAILLIVAGTRGETVQLYTQASNDAKGFLPLFVLIVVAGFLGQVAELRKLSNAILLLILISYALMSGKQIMTGLQAAA